MEDYLEQKEDQEGASEKALEEPRDKAAEDKDTRNKAMEHVERRSETKKRAGSDLPKKKRIHHGNDPLKYLREASDRYCELKKQELEFRMAQEKSAAANKPLYASAND